VIDPNEIRPSWRRSRAIPGARRPRPAYRGPHKEPIKVYAGSHRLILLRIAGVAIDMFVAATARFASRSLQLDDTLVALSRLVRYESS
jgi:hypothetical protein